MGELQAHAALPGPRAYSWEPLQYVCDLNVYTPPRPSQSILVGNLGANKSGGWSTPRFLASRDVRQLRKPNA